MELNNNITLQEINVKEFKEKLYQDYHRIFPEDERKPLSLIRDNYNKGYTKIIAIIHDAVIVGFMLLNRVKENGYAILDYLAILPQYRNQSLGTKAIKLLIEQEKNSNGIFVEIEKIGLGKTEEENLYREKRKSFYENVGFKKMRYDLFLFDVIYTPYIVSNIHLDEEHIVNQLLEIYETTVGKERIQKNCKFIHNLIFEELSKEILEIAAKTQYEIFPNASGYAVYKSKVEGTRKSFYVSYVAYFEDKPVGVIGLYEIPKYKDTAWLSWFGIMKEHRRMGFGRQMLDFIIRVAKQNNKKFLRLYTFEIWNNEAQKFYQKNMDIGEYYYNEQESKTQIYDGKPKIFSLSLCNEKVEPWNNKFINISEDEDTHEKSIIMMKKDGIII